MTVPPLTERLRWLGIEDCTCPWEWKSLGRLYGVSMGKTWVRMTTAPDCPRHQGVEKGKK